MVEAFLCISSHKVEFQDVRGVQISIELALASETVTT